MGRGPHTRRGSGTEDTVGHFRRWAEKGGRGADDRPGRRRGVPGRTTREGDKGPHYTLKFTKDRIVSKDTDTSRIVWTNFV